MPFTGAQREATYRTHRAHDHAELLQQLERKQTEIDEARAALRAAGASGFGSLAEGVQQLVQAASKLDTPRSFAMELSPDDIERMLDRIKHGCERLCEEENFRVQVPFRMEVLTLALRLYHNATHTDTDDVVRNVEAQLLAAIKQHITRKESNE